MRELEESHNAEEWDVELQRLKAAIAV